MASTDDIPEYLRRHVMFNRKIQIGKLKHESFEVVLTVGPKLHLTKEKQVLATICDLSKTTVGGLTCQQSDFDVLQLSQNVSKSFDFDVYFTYNGGRKDVFFLLKMMDKLIVMSKRIDAILLHKEYENVRAFHVIHEDGSNVNLKIEKTDESVLCDNLYRTSVDYPNVPIERFGGIYESIANRVAVARAELETTKLDVQKYFYELGKELRFGSNTLRDAIEERVMLAKFGDIWIRRHNDMLLLGVPVYNCCYLSKRLIENIRVILLSDQFNQYDFDYKLYKFEIDETAVPNYDEILNKEENFGFPAFNQEWLPSEKNTLQPDTAAIIVIKTNLPNFVGFATLEFDCFLHYEILDDGKMHALQNCAGRISVSSDIFYDTKFLVKFDKDNVYKDLLTATSTSESIFIKLKFSEISIKEYFYDFIISSGFEKINENHEENLDGTRDMFEDKFDFLSSSHVEQHSTNIYFLSKGSSYWKDTLIRTYTHSNGNGLVDELKIYNKCKDRILSLIQSIRTKFDKNISIEITDRTSQLSELKYAFRKEVDFIKNNMNVMARNADDENFLVQKMQAEFETDLAYLNL